jgi:hypothetical protein
LGRCLKTAPRCGGKERAMLEKCITAVSTLYQTFSANFLFCLITTSIGNNLYMRLGWRFALVKQQKPAKSMKKVKICSFETGS